MEQTVSIDSGLSSYLIIIVDVLYFVKISNVTEEQKNKATATSIIHRTLKHSIPQSPISNKSIPLTFPRNDDDSLKSDCIHGLKYC
jgi:hypothetical protein